MILKLRVLAVCLAISVVVLVFGHNLYAAGCATGKCGGSVEKNPSQMYPSTELQVKDIRAVISKNKDKTLSFYGSVFRYGSEDYGSNKVEVNLGGYWRRVSGSVSYLSDGGGVYTKVTLQHTDTLSNTYYYSKAGAWTSKDQCSEETRGIIPLDYVLNGGQTKLDLSYDTVGQRVTMAGAEGGIIIYGGVDRDDPDSKVSRVWAGTNATNYRDVGVTPTDGRWVDLELDDNGNITKMTNGCSSCGAIERSYEYVGAKSNMIVTSVNPLAYKPSHYLLSEVKDSSENVIASYEYDEKDALTSQKIGSVVQEENDYEYFTWEVINDPEDENYDSSKPTTIAKVGSNKRTRRKYTSGVDYLEFEYLADKNGRVTELREHNSSGHFGRTLYQYTVDGAIRTKIKTLPNGNKVNTISTSGGIFDEVIRFNKQGDVQIGGGKKRYDSIGNLIRYVNTAGGTTDYQYSSGRLNAVISPDADGAGRFSTLYEYDSNGNITFEIAKGSRTLTTRYDYDNFGNQETKIDAYGTGSAVTTTYDYNTYNEVTKINLPGGSSKKNFYSEHGSLVAEVSYSDTNCTTVLKAKQYEYDSEGRVTRESIANLREPFSGEYTSISSGSLVDQDFLYDTYGRRTAIIADASGEQLTTGYEYDNQSQVTKVTRPNGSSTTTLLNALGRPSKTISSKGANSATTNYYYDLNGNLTKQEDPEGVTEVYDYDGFDRRIRSRKLR